RLPDLARRPDALCRPDRARPYPRPPRRYRRAGWQQGARAGAAAGEACGERRQIRRRRGSQSSVTSAARPLAWEKSYPPGCRWDAPIATTTLTALLERAVIKFADRP